MIRLLTTLTILLVVSFPALAQNQGTVNISIYGDSLGDGLWSGLTTILKKNPNCKVNRHSKIGAGLTRADYLNWIEELPKQIESEKPKLALLLFGANDQQGLRDDKKGHAFKSQSWREAYALRMGSIIKELKNNGTIPFWISLPIMAENEANQNAIFLNELFLEKARKENIAFLAIANDFVDKEGKFTTHMNDAKGRSQQIRKSDGIHFTGYGYELLANKIWKEVETILHNQGIDGLCQ